MGSSHLCYLFASHLFFSHNCSFSYFATPFISGQKLLHFLVSSDRLFHFGYLKFIFCFSCDLFRSYCVHCYVYQFIVKVKWYCLLRGCLEFWNHTNFEQCSELWFLCSFFVNDWLRISPTSLYILDCKLLLQNYTNCS